MSVAVHAAEALEDAVRARRRDERLLACALAASLVVHLAAALIGPALRKPPPEPPRPLEVVIVTPPVPQPVRIEPPTRPKPPPPVARTVEVKPRPQPKPAPVAPERKPVLALQETPSAAPAFVVPQTPVEAPPAPPAPAAQAESKAVAAAPAAPAAPAKEAATTQPVFNAAYLGNAPPRYPIVARRSGVEGTVHLRVVVSREGRPVHVAVERTSGSTALDNAALEAVRGWKFAPARRGQEPVEQAVTVPVVFRLEGSS